MRTTDQEALRAAVKLYSKNFGISQSELADSAQVSQPQISRFMTGMSKLSFETSERVSKALSRIVGERVAAIGLMLPATMQQTSEPELRT
jgi:predicted transcriptional regulator